MKKLAIVFACWALTLGFAASASAATTKWVDQAGGDDVNNDGNTEGTAYATLQFAIDNSVSGMMGTPSIINVKDGAYATASQTACGFDAGIVVSGKMFLTIQAMPGQEPSAKPTVGTSMSIENSQNVIIDNIDLDGSLAGFDLMHVCDSFDVTVKNSTIEFGLDGIDVESSHNVFLIENNVFRALSADAVDFSDGAYSDITIQDNLFEANNRRPILIRNLGSAPIGNFIIRRNISLGTNDQEAFRVIGADNVLIENNVIMNSHQQGLYIDTNLAGGSPSKNITVQHNTFFNNDQENGNNGELRTKVTSADIVIKNNIFYANGLNDIFETPVASLPSEDFNLVFNSPQIGSFTFGASTITGDPLFVDITAGSEDLHLQPGSPAIGTGTDLGVTDDNEKSIRPNPAATNPDRGAYEIGAITVQVDIDIKFCSDPNAFNCRKKGVLPVTIFGTASFDASDIDPSTLQLCLADLSACTNAPKDWSIADRGDPTIDLGASMCAINPATGLELHFLNTDTFPDFDAAFEASEVQAMLGVFCSGPKNGVSPTLVIIGSTIGGIPISSAPIGNTGIDQLVKKGK